MPHVTFFKKTHQMRRRRLSVQQLQNYVTQDAQPKITILKKLVMKFVQAKAKATGLQKKKNKGFLHGSCTRGDQKVSTVRLSGVGQGIAMPGNIKST